MNDVLVLAYDLLGCLPSLGVLVCGVAFFGGMIALILSEVRE